MIDPPPPLAEGGPPPGAGWLNQLVAYLASCGISIDASSGLTGSTGPNGTTIGYQRTPAIYIKITHVGTSGSYSWIEQIPAAGGGWTDGVRRGYTPADPARSALTPAPPADPAWEANANATIAVGFRAEASRDPAVGRLTFRAGTC